MSSHQKQNTKQIRSFVLLRSFYNRKASLVHSGVGKEDKVLVKYLINCGLLKEKSIRQKKVYIPRFSEKDLSEMDFIHTSILNTISMVTKYEKTFRTIIHEGIIKDWVGIGWVDLRLADNEDYKKYPIAIV